jgi:hypothetical protein
VVSTACAKAGASTSCAARIGQEVVVRIDQEQGGPLLRADAVAHRRSPERAGGQSSGAPGSGHWLMEEAPEATIPAILEFIR